MVLGGDAREPAARCSRTALARSRLSSCPARQRRALFILLLLQLLLGRGSRGPLTMRLVASGVGGSAAGPHGGGGGAAARSVAPMAAGGVGGCEAAAGDAPALFWGEAVRARASGGRTVSSEYLLRGCRPSRRPAHRAFGACY